MKPMPVVLAKWLAFCKRPDVRRLQQFGQGDDESTYNGATGCTHTDLQRLILALTGEHVTHDEISLVAGYPWPHGNPRMRGLYSGGVNDEVGRVIKHYGLPYKLVIAPLWKDMIRYMKRGPVITGVLYGYWPEQHGATYNGHTADGKPGGFAYEGGKTQLSGAERVYHAVLFLGRGRPFKHMSIWANEPNHGSPSRPEHPVHDKVNSAYAHRAWDQYRYRGRKNFAWVPTKTVVPK